MLETVTAFACEAGTLLREHFGRVQGIRIKDSRSSIVTDADLAADRLLCRRLREAFPQHNLLTEEGGWQDRGSAWTWIVDPLDGTSNFAAGIPWFGVMIALLDGGRPVLGVMHLPLENRVYAAETGRGATCDGKPVHVTAETQLSQVLCGFGLDAGADSGRVARQAAVLGRVIQQVRNIRSTNSLVDFTLTLDGRLGASVNFHTRIWDIAAPWLLFHEAGGVMTGLSGEPLTFAPGADASDRSYAIVAGAPALQQALVAVLAPDALALAPH